MLQFFACGKINGKTIAFIPAVAWEIANYFIKRDEWMQADGLSQIKKPLLQGTYWVDDRVRTGDPQNHNLML